MDDNFKRIDTVSIRDSKTGGTDFIAVDNGIGAGTLFNGCNSLIGTFPTEAVKDWSVTIADCSRDISILPLVNRYDIGVGRKIGKSFQLFRRVCNKNKNFAGEGAVFIFYLDLRLACLYRRYNANSFVGT